MNLYSEIANGTITVEEAQKISADPSTKLSKAEELLAAARIRKQEAEERREGVKADPDIKHDSPEYVSARSNLAQTDKSTNTWEAKVAELALWLPKSLNWRNSSSTKTSSANSGSKPSLLL